MRYGMHGRSGGPDKAMRGCGVRRAMHRGGRGFGGGFGPGRGGRFRDDEGDGGGRRRRRMFDSGEFRLVLLKLIADEPRHGYELIRQIEELTGGAYAPSPGVVYPALTLLDEMGQIGAQESEGSRKRFAITPDGQAELDANRAMVDALIARLASVGEEQQRTDGTAIRRAMGNLRQVLVNRLGAHDLDEATLHQAVALIDEAAQKIERL